MLKKIDRYLIGKYLGTFLYAILLFAAISVVIDLADRIDDFLENNLSLLAIFKGYYANFVPYIIFFLSPLFIFIAVIFFTAQLANRSEIIAIISSGVSFYRLLFGPYLISAIILTLVQLYGNHYWVPTANQTRYVFEDNYIKKKRISTDRNLHIKMDRDNYVYVESFNFKDTIGRRFTIENIVNRRLLRKLSAEKIIWNSKTQRWKLENYFERQIDSLKETIRQGEALDTMLHLTPNDFQYQVNFKECMTTPALKAFIQKEIEKGAPFIEFYQVELYRRTATPFATFILTAIGLAIASRRVRGGMGLHIAWGIGLSSLYIMLLQFATTFATNGSLPPLLAVWMPNLAFFILSVYLVLKAQK